MITIRNLDPLPHVTMVLDEDGNLLTFCHNCLKDLKLIKPTRSSAVWCYKCPSCSHYHEVLSKEE